MLGIDLDKNDVLAVALPGGRCEIDLVKPYLRPLSSITEEEKEEYHYMVFDYEYDDYWYPGKYTDAICVADVDELVDWFNAHHFDYRGLIPKGLALPAPEDMYIINNK